MDARALAKVSLRTLAVYVIAQGILILPGFADVVERGAMTPSDELYLAVAMFAPFVTGLLLWRASARIAIWASAESKGSESKTQLNAAAIQAVAFVCIGLVFVIQAVAEIFGVLYEVLFLGPDATVLLRGNHFFAEIVKVIFGVVLILGARFFARLFRRLREFGLEADKS